MSIPTSHPALYQLIYRKALIQGPRNLSLRESRSRVPQPWLLPTLLLAAGCPQLRHLCLDSSALPLAMKIIWNQPFHSKED